MAEYIVTRPWFGVKKGQRLTIPNLHPALRPNVRLLSQVEEEGVDIVDLGEERQVPGAQDPLGLADNQGNGNVEFDWERVRGDLIEELTDSGVDFDAEAPAAELAALLDEEVREGIKLGAE